jgi:hypothetical protein
MFYTWRFFQLYLQASNTKWANLQYIKVKDFVATHFYERFNTLLFKIQYSISFIVLHNKNFSLTKTVFFAKKYFSFFFHIIMTVLHQRYTKQHSWFCISFLLLFPSLLKKIKKAKIHTTMDKFWFYATNFKEIIMQK